MIWWAAFMIGLAGSLHCAGMCSPIVLTIPINLQNKVTSLFTLTLYNLGRLVTYVLLGFIIGFFAKGLDLTGFQNYFTIITGISILIILLFSIDIEAWLGNLPFYQRIKTLISRLMKYAYSKHPFQGAMIIGLANGLLPCGLVYLAIAGALTTSGPVEGMAFMAFFGLGTFPMLTIIPIFVKAAEKRLRFQSRKYLPILLGLMALLFIYRGLEMGDFLSPILNPDNPADASCVE